MSSNHCSYFCVSITILFLLIESSSQAVIPGQQLQEPVHWNPTAVPLQRSQQSYHYPIPNQIYIEEILKNWKSIPKESRAVRRKSQIDSEYWSTNDCDYKCTRKCLGICITSCESICRRN
ncbi:uncharacterized protein DEA37_0008825 [Paragonimus westermani]|uniref:Uncharacterized protein n=1 Tax=Paragonimus westermani TaxID=34504 RepID=A0A5J4NR28_9TREM|nr:uncharacterized protein DEA37_0008825 [Paragonimus westermani]